MRSIQSRQFVLLLGSLLVSLAAGGGAVYWVARSGLVSQFDAGLSARAHMIAALVKEEPGALVFERGDAPVAAINEAYFELRERGGSLLKRSDTLEGRTLPVAEPAIGEMLYDDVELPGGRHGRATWFTFEPRRDPDDWHGVSGHTPQRPLLTVATALDRSSMDQALASLAQALAGVSIALAAVLTAVVWLGLRWGLAPLKRLTAQLGDVKGDASPSGLDGAGAPAELTPVYCELNRALERVRSVIERERTFADAAAHELRTPLAELRAAAEVARRWPDARATGDVVADVLDIGAEMERLVESLLAMSRSGRGGSASAAETVPLMPLVRRQLEHARSEIGAKRLSVTVDMNEAASVQAPRDAVETVLRNLIDNAVAYTAPGGQVAIGNGSGPGGCPSFTVSNGPVVLTEADLPHLFEPFWRSDSSHADRTHAGLGLSVVQRIADTVGFRVTTHLQDGCLTMNVECAAAGPRLTDQAC